MKDYHWKSLDFDSYKEYLSSWLWKEKRDFFLRLNPNCKTCNKPATEVHHRNYDSVGNEGTSDLISLCSKCHNKIHEEENGGD